MHKSSYLRMEYLVNYYEKIISEGREQVNVLDIGSYAVNGSYRKIFNKEFYNYCGLDMSAGPNVDIVPDNIYEWNEIDNNTYDLVISGQALEHIEFPWLTIKEIERVLKPSGICIIIAPSSTLEHRYPVDCYRYYPDGMVALANWAGLNTIHVSTAGVPEISCSADWVSDHNDTVLVAQKSPKTIQDLDEPFMYEKRLEHEKVINKYRTWELAVSEGCKLFNKEKSIILFGAGIIGERVLNILGGEKVYCFVDNSPEKIGRKFCGKDVISFEDYCKISQEYNCLITVSENVTHELIEQMKGAGQQPGGVLYPW